MGNLVFGGSERPGNPIDTAEVPIVRDNDVAIGQGARPNERPDENSAQAASAARHIDMKLKLGLCPFYGELRPHLTRRRLGRDLPSYQVAS